MRTVVVLFTRDLRIHDQPALHAAAARAEQIVPLFVFDEAIVSTELARPNRMAFLVESLADLDSSLRQLGGRLCRRSGDVVRETMRTVHEARAEAIFVTEDVSSYARRRTDRLSTACDDARIELCTFPGTTVVGARELRPSARDHYEVFSSYWKRWRAIPRRTVLLPPRRLTVPATLRTGRSPARHTLVTGPESPSRPPGGETAGRAVMTTWLRELLDVYASDHDAPADDATSRLSPYLHFGCVSPRELEDRATGSPGGDAFVRQLCWRDFYHQLLAARPDTTAVDLRDRNITWSDDERALDAWKRGRTGYPFVDAGMRQLATEGWMHNRLRLVTASFLTRHLNVDWRRGAAHYFDLLVDGDVANNVGNWQWVAGTGVDSRPNRVFNPVRQGQRLDPDGRYVRRYVPELRKITNASVHQPWNLEPGMRRGLGYPARIVSAPRGAPRAPSRQHA